MGNMLEDAMARERSSLADERAHRAARVADLRTAARGLLGRLGIDALRLTGLDETPLVIDASAAIPGRELDDVQLWIGMDGLVHVSRGGLLLRHVGASACGMWSLRNECDMDRLVSVLAHVAVRGAAPKFSWGP